MGFSNDPFFPEGLPGPPARAVPGPPAEAASGSGSSPSVPAIAAPGAVPDILALANALRARWITALCLGLCAAAAAGSLAWRFVPKPKSTATAVLEVKIERPGLLPGSAGTRPDTRFFQSTQLSLVRSRLVLTSALARPGVADLPTVRAQPDPVEWLADELNAEFTGGELLQLSLTGDRPTDLAALVNAVAESYLEEIVTKDHTERLASLGQLKDLLDQYNARLTRRRAELREMAEAVGSDDRQTLALKQQMAVQQLGDEKRELTQVETELKRSRAELKVLNEAGDEPGNEDALHRAVEEALDREPAVMRLHEQSAALALKYERARRLVRTEGDPSVRESRRALESVRRAEAEARQALRPRIEHELRAQEDDQGARRASELETRVRVLAEYEKVLKQGIARLETEAQAFNRQSIDLQWKKDEIAQGEEVARQLGRQIESLNVDLKAPQRGRLIEPAAGAKAESRRKWLVMIAMAVLGAFGLSASGVAWREYSFRRVTSTADVTRGLGLRLVGTLPALPGTGRTPRGGGSGESDPDAHDAWQAALIESIDAARTVILRECRAGGLRTILITSADKGEGKSSLSGHLAISLARTGRRVLLADLDLRHPTVHKLFDVSLSPGAGELLRGEAEPEDVVTAVGSDLDVLTAGRADPKALRGLGQDDLPELLARLAGRYDFVVIDSAPLLPVADTLLISQHVDAALLSVFREVSRIPAVYAGYERLTALGVRVLGAVVTGVPVDRSATSSLYAAAREA
ncbi:MAG: division plane positioning ATPase MipZ [Isosphaeraceae bacterium]